MLSKKYQNYIIDLLTLTQFFVKIVQKETCMKDFSKYKIDEDVFYSGAERKGQITINGNRYIIKYQKSSEIGLIYNHVSEYLGSHIFELFGIPVQDTELGVYKGENIVLLRNFCEVGEVLVHFNDVGESSLEEDKELFQYSYGDIQKMLEENRKLTLSIQIYRKGLQ